MKRTLLAVAIAALSVCLSTIAFAQAGPASDFNSVLVTITNELTVTGGVEQEFVVAPGQTYSCRTDGVLVPPDAEGTDAVDPLLWTIEGTPGAAVQIVFTLPTRLYDPAIAQSIPLTFSPLDGLWDNTGDGGGLVGNAFDPRSPYTDFLDPDGAANVFLGYTLHVPTFAAGGGDGFGALIYMTAGVTGF